MRVPPESKRRSLAGAALQFLKGVKHPEISPAKANPQAPSSWRPLGYVVALVLARLDSGRLDHAA